MNEIHDTQAIAARLTAIAERRRRAVAGDPYPFADIDTLSAHVETLTLQVAELTAENAQLRRAYLEARTGMCQAEQQRDSAHVALKAAQEALKVIAECPPECVHLMPLAADAALAASAPQKEKV
jgi:outer membrane murein-binding lipoprotein Lpp